MNGGNDVDDETVSREAEKCASGSTVCLMQIFSQIYSFSLSGAFDYFSSSPKELCNDIGRKTCFILFDILPRGHSSCKKQGAKTKKRKLCMQNKMKFMHEFFEHFFVAVQHNFFCRFLPLLRCCCLR